MSEPLSFAIDLPDEAATAALGRQLGARLRRGQGVALVGELGAGKTCLTRGIGRGLRLDDPEAVSSPTWLLVVEHPGPVPLVHVDAYLPGKARAFLADGGLDYLAELDAAVVVEWADRLADLLPEPTLWVFLGPGPRGGRRAVLEDRGGFGWVAEVVAGLGGGEASGPSRQAVDPDPREDPPSGILSP